ncbi:MAG: TonB-dependent receptor [Phenylobacterium sp.]|uniref:TonB-dependent receptor n=1 Tax=Phenylobacterium sp. TaxID=1871053 RepID=UPI001226470D|nr:TonB-dependent receptor [Phenylobacterium sp.]TAJ72770.1 MAG: TonB-dependent receptor [Phenylobacterium sp.]
MARMFGRQARLLGGVAAAALSVSAAQAAEPVESAVSEVVVTAQFREENVQRVPIPITAVGGEDLAKQGVIGFKELGARVPSLRFGAGVTGGENVITMRGLGSQNTTPGGDSPVAYNIDGVYVQRTTSIDPEFYDIARVEVLRGPQGTLYGRNSVGGSINIITNKPTGEFGAGVDAILGNYDARTFRGFVNVPLVTDGDMQIAARLTAVSAEHDPYTKNLSAKPTATKQLDRLDYQMIRAQLAIDFNPQARLLLAAHRTWSEGVAATATAWWQTPARYTTPPLGVPIGSPCDFSTAAKFNPRRVCHDYPDVGSNDTQLYSGTLEYEMPFANFTSVTAYGKSHVDQISDGDGSDLPLSFGSAWRLDAKQFSQEVRFTSNGEGPLTWLVGGIYFYGKNFQDFAYSDTGYNDSGPTAPFNRFNFLSSGTSKTKALAAFGQFDYDFGNTSAELPLILTVGLRYTRDKKTGFNALDYQLPIACGGSCGVTAGPFSETWNRVTGKLGLSYQVNEKTMVFASVARGYLAGGNITGLGNIYDPETLTSFDVGLKSRFFDDRVQLNVAAYHQEIKNLQVFIQSATQSGINNVDGKTDVNGLEVELSAVPVDNLRLNATATLTDAEYGRYITTAARFGGPGPGCDPVTRLCNFKGNNLNQTPPYTVNLGAEYRFETAFGAITPRIDAYFSGRVDFLADNYITSRQKSYHTTNARVTWESVDRRYRIEAFVANIEDDDIISNDGLQSISLGQQAIQPDNFVYYPPRTYGVRLGVNF